LSDLRLAPLSTRFESSSSDLAVKSPLRTPYDVEEDTKYARKHPTYLQGQSAPTTPSILSRSSSKKRPGGGLSRRGSLYDAGDDADVEESYAYGGGAAGRTHAAGERAEMGSGQIPKAKSEAALLRRQHHDTQSYRLSGPGVPLSHRPPFAAARGRRSGTVTPTPRRPDERETWLTHTGAITSAIVREDKGQSWLASKQNSTSLGPGDSEDDEDDDHYEEMAALSASTVTLRLEDFQRGSPVTTRQSRSAWGSRYGSRSTSRRTSRLASPVGSRTPRRTNQAGYFDYPTTPAGEVSGFLSPPERRGEGVEDEREISQLSNPDSFGLGKMVDRVIKFNFFNVGDLTDTTDDEETLARRYETAEEAQRRMEAEHKRRKEEKEKLTTQPRPVALRDEEDAKAEVGGWQDAAWLLSVASKALF
jgi:hypothetical protein